VVGVGDEAGAARLAALGVAAVVHLVTEDAEATAAALGAAVGEVLLGAGPAAGASATRPRTSRAADQPGRDDGERARAGAEPPRPRLVAVTGASGSPGRTSVAVALADEAARRGVRALLIDADTRAPSVAPLLALPDDLPGVAACARAAETAHLDVEVMARHALALPSGLRVLTGLTRPDRWAELRPAALEAVLAVAVEAADLVVLDVGPVPVDDELLGDVVALPREAAAATCLDAADLAVVVGAAEPIGLLRLVRALDDLREGWAHLDREVVLCRARASAVGGEPQAAVTPVLSRHASVSGAVLVPDDRASYDAAALAGLTLAECAPSSPARTVLRALAEGLVAPASQAAARSAAISSSRRRAWRSLGSR
jgi:Mrp family chromosome partitioning ATPase